MKTSLIAACLSCLGSTLLAVDPPPAEPGAVVDKAIPFTLPVSELTSSGFIYTEPNGTKQKLVVTTKTEVMQGDRAAVFGDIKLGDIVTGTLTKTTGTNEWKILKITKFEPAPKKP